MVHSNQILIVFFVILHISWSIDVKFLQDNVPIAIGVMLGASESDTSAECLKDISEILRGISEREPWALQGNTFQRFIK